MGSASAADVQRQHGLPFGRRHRFTGGWKLNGLYTANSGIPLSVSGAESLGRMDFDLSARKTFTLHEKLKAQFRAEAFNAFNRTEFDTPGSSLGANFGVVRSQNNFARQIQLALKLLW